MMSDNSKYSWKQLINAEAFGILCPVSDAILKNFMPAIECNAQTP